MSGKGNIRSFLALFQAGLLCLIMVSGMVFMHKHQTQDGRIVIHIHPYDLSADADKPHHNSDDEIHLLDVVFQGVYLATATIPVDFQLLEQFRFSYQEKATNPIFDSLADYRYLRGPPIC